jgi:hypothetical protein
MFDYDNCEKRRAELSAKAKVGFANANIFLTHYAMTFCELLGFGSSQGYHKLRCGSDLRLPQVALIEQHFRIRLLHVDIEPGSQTFKAAPGWISADFQAENRRDRYRVIIGRALHNPASSLFAAYVDRGCWRVCLLGEREVNAPLFQIEQLF